MTRVDTRTSASIRTFGNRTEQTLISQHSLHILCVNVQIHRKSQSTIADAPAKVKAQATNLSRSRKLLLPDAFDPHIAPSTAHGYTRLRQLKRCPYGHDGGPEAQASPCRARRRGNGERNPRRRMWETRLPRASPRAHRRARRAHCTAREAGTATRSAPRP